MKASRLKSLIKEAVKEAIQEEMKEIILEAVKSNSKPTLNEDLQFTTQNLPPTSPSDMKSRRQAYIDILDETRNESKSTPTFTPNQIDTTVGELPKGDVPMDMISNLIGK